MLHEDCMCGKPAGNKTDLWSREKRMEVISLFTHLLMFVHSAGEGAIQMLRNSLFFT